MFSLSTGDSTTTKGASDASPMYIPGMTEHEFEMLLRCTYDG